MLYSLDDAKAASNHRIQYFETGRNRAIYQDGWIAATTPKDMPWALANHGDWSIDDQKWELYHLTDDFSEAVDLAAKEPQRVHDLQELFWAEAARYHVLPLMDVVKQVMSGAPQAPSPIDGVSKFTFYPGMIRVPDLAAPNVKNRSFTAVADIDLPASGAEGILLTEGDRFGGYSFYLLKGRPVFCYNMAGFVRYTIAAPEAVPAGHHSVTADFKYDGGGRAKGGTVTLLVDGKAVASGRVEQTIANRFALDASMSVGEGTGLPVSSDYQTPFKFTAALTKLTLTLN